MTPREAEPAERPFPARTAFNVLLGAIIALLLFQGLEPLLIRPLLSHFRVVVAPK